MNHRERAEELRRDLDRHHNCCQSVLMTFAEDMGLTEEEAFRLGANMGAGMRVGSACGAVTGALMTLGALGYGEEESMAFLRQFEQNHAAAGSLDCNDLLEKDKSADREKKPFCDGLVFEAVDYLCHLTGKP